MKITDAAIDRAAEAAFRAMYPATDKPGWDKWHVLEGPPKGLAAHVKEKWRKIAHAALTAAQADST